MGFVQRMPNPASIRAAPRESDAAKGRRERGTPEKSDAEGHRCLQTGGGRGYQTPSPQHVLTPGDIDLFNLNFKYFDII